MKFGDVMRYGVYLPLGTTGVLAPTSKDSNWLCMTVAGQTMMTLAEPVIELPMYGPGNVFTWSVRNPETSWRVETNE